MYKPEFTLSKTRIEMFLDCQKKYFFQYYDWSMNPDTGINRKSVYSLKQMKNTFTLVGEAVHRAAKYTIENWVSHKQLPNDLFLKENVNKIYEYALMESADLQLWKRNPKERVMLHEIYYAPNYFPHKMKIPNRLNLLVSERIEDCVNNLLGSYTLDEIMEEDSVNVIEHEVLGSVTITGYKVYAKLELLYSINDKWVIVDWKTGKRNKNQLEILQMGIYAAYVIARYQVPLEQIQIRTEYLLTGEWENKTFTQEEMSEIESIIAVMATSMGDLLEDVQDNKPLTIDFIDASPAFSKCDRCNFKEVCNEGSTEVARYLNDYRTTSA